MILGTGNGAVLKVEGDGLCMRLDSVGESRVALSRPLFFKRHCRAGSIAWCKRAVGWHGAVWMWQAAWKMRRLNIPAPEPNGYLDPTFQNPGACSFFWSEWVEPALTLRQMAEAPKTRDQVINSQKLPIQAGDILARLHNHGLYHRDTSWKNFLLNPETEQLLLVDIDGVNRGGIRPETAAVRDIARFLTDAVISEADASWMQLLLTHYATCRQIPLSKIKSPLEEKLNQFLGRKGWYNEQER